MTPDVQTAVLPASRPTTRASDTAGQTTRSRGRRRVVVFTLVAVVAVAAVVAWRTYFSAPVSNDVIALSGRIEGDVSMIAPKSGGRIKEIRVGEGDIVKAGDTIAVLDDEQVRAREEQARAALGQAEARANSARDQVAVLQERLVQAQLGAEQSKVDASGRVSQADADLAAAEAQLAQQEASYQLALFDKEAYTRLAQTGAVSERQGKVAASTADQQAAVVAAAHRRVDAAKSALAMARANLTNPAIRAAEIAGVRGQLAQQKAEIASATAQIEQVRAQLTEAQANRQDLVVRAPFTGTVMTKSAEPGEVVMAGTPLVSLVDLEKVYLRGYVPEGRIGSVKSGQPARVYLDSSPNSPLDAYVSRIDPQATFTPENIYFRDDRVKQVVGVKLQIKSGVGFAKPGMPADGEILVSGTQWPKAGRQS
jgi:HlyD family secretion protein